MLKHLKYIWEGLLLIGSALSLVVFVILCMYIISVASCPTVWGVFMLLGTAWIIGWLLDPAI